MLNVNDVIGALRTMVYGRNVRINAICVVPNVCFFFNDTATTEIYTLSLHDALPISIAKFFAKI